MLNLALLHPRLLSTMILIEPALLPDPKGIPFDAVYPLTFRRDTWPDRDAAVKAHLRVLFGIFGLESLPQNQKRSVLALRALQDGVVTRREL